MPLIILDRDGVINEDSDDYIKHPDEWIPIPGSLEAIARLNQAGYQVAIATNQSGLARGYFDHRTLDAMHQKMRRLLAEVGGEIAAIEFCGDHPDQATEFRKPGTGMVKSLLSRFEARPEDVWFVGDSSSDIECARRSGCRPALVCTGKGDRTYSKLQQQQLEMPPVYDSLSQFVDALLESLQT